MLIQVNRKLLQEKASQKTLFAFQVENSNVYPFLEGYLTFCHAVKIFITLPSAIVSCPFST